MTSLNERVQIVVKTFERPEFLRRLLDSIEEFYPNLRIIVADDSEEYSKPKRPQEVILKLPFDTGLKAGRQIAMGCVTTEFYLLLDDDYKFIQRTKIEELVRISDHYNLDMLGANVEDYGKGIPRQYHGIMTGTNRRLILGPPRPSKTPDMVICDYIPNFYLARTNSIRRIGGYDCRLKVGGHAEIFWRAKQHKLRVGYTKNVAIEHWPDWPNKKYANFRSRCMPELSTFWAPIARQEYGFDHFPP